MKALRRKRDGFFKGNSNVLFLTALIFLTANLGAWAASVKQPAKPNHPGKTPNLLTAGESCADVKVSQLAGGNIIVDIRVKAVRMAQVSAGGEQFKTFTISGYKSTSQVGKPELPVIRELLAVGDEATVQASIIAGSYQTYTLDGFRVLPVQPPMVDGADRPEFVIDDAFYKQQGFYPSSLIELEGPSVWRDLTVVNLHVNPVAYNPATGRLRVYKHIKILVESSPNAGAGKKVSPRLANMYRRRIRNYDALGIDEVLPTLNEPAALGPAQSGEPPIQAAGIPYDTSVKLLAIRHTDCAAWLTLYPLLDWHRRCGLPWVLVSESGALTADDVKATITSYYNSHPELEYVLLVGDIDYIPWKQNWDGDAWPNDLPGDHWYACITGGDSPDLYADVAVGRLPAKSDAELQQMVTKILDYAKNPPPGGWANTALLVAHKESAPYKYQQCSEQIRTDTYNVDPFYFWTAYGASTAAQGDDAVNADVIGAMEAGVHIVNYRGHGGKGATGSNPGPPYGQYWGSDWNTSGEEFTIAEANSANNGGKLPVVFSISCTNAWLDGDDEVLGEAFVKDDQGAVAFLGATRPSYTTPNHDFDKSLFDAIGNQGIYNIGWILNTADANLIATYGEASYAADNIKMYLWLGDPALELWTYAPIGLDVTHPAQVATGVMTVTVRDEYSNLVPDALVCLDGCGVYTTKYTDAAGQATFNFIPDTTGAMDVTVTKHYYIPYEGQTQVVPLANAISNIQFTPLSPSSLCFGEQVSATFNYTTDDPGGIRIFMRPFTDGSLTPHYGAHGSGWYPYPSGTGSGWFTINSGDVVVDHVRFQIYNHDQSELLLTLFEPVNYTYGHSVHNVTTYPPSPATMKWDHYVDLEFDYFTCEAGGVRIFVLPYTDGAPTPGYAGSGSILYPEGTGSGTASFRIVSGQVTVDQLKVWMTNPDQSQVLSEDFIPVEFYYEGYPDIAVAPAEFDIELTPPALWNGTLNIYNNGDGTLHYSLRDRRDTNSDAGVTQASLAISATADDTLDSDGTAVQPIIPIIPNPLNLVFRDLLGLTLAYDLTHNEVNPSQMDAVKTDLTARGAKINYITAGPITGDLLEPYDILWVNEDMIETLQWSMDERAAVQGWLEKGRGLLLYGDQPGQAAALAKSLGIAYGTTTPTAGYTTNITPHPITEDVNQLYAPGPLKSLSVNSPAYTIVSDRGAVPTIAGAEPAAGRAAALCDDYFWGPYLEYADNRTMANRLFSWLTPLDSEWLDENPKIGSVETDPPASEQIALEIDSAPLLRGHHFADICITSDDPDGMPVIVPLHLTVLPSNSMTNITTDPPSPASLPFGENLYINFDYFTNEPGGVKIFVRPFTDGSLTPNYSAHGSQLYPPGSGQVLAWFTINSGQVTVDQLRFAMYNADQSELLLEFFIDVEFHFADLAAVDISLMLEGENRPDPDGWQIPVTAAFFKPGAHVLTATPLYTFDLKTSRSTPGATCRACWVPPGTYDMTLTADHTLINVTRSVGISSPSTAVDMGTLAEGNALPDYTIDLLDFSVLASTWLLSHGQFGFDAQADFDYDGTVNWFDVSLLADHWLNTSPREVP